MSSEPRLVDVAQRAGVSVATVSRVLNDRGYLSDATRSRVAEAIAELGYRPNQVARSLIGKRTGSIGLILPSVALPFFGEVAVGVENALAEHGFQVQLCNSLGHTERERELLNRLVGNRVDGIISGAHNDQLAEYQQLRLPVVTIDRELASHIPNVRSDNERGGVLATELLLSSGSRRPALLTSRSHDRNLRERGYRKVLSEAGIEPVILTANFNIPEPQRSDQVRAALHQVADQIDGVFATDDLLAATALEWAHYQGREVPAEFRVVGFDGTQAIRQALPGLSTIQQPIAQLCATAVEVLLGQIETRASGEELSTGPVAATELPVSLVRGRTC